MPSSALPEHLRSELHNDWIWPLCYIPRGWNAFGYRCKNWFCKWRETPKLIVGYGVARWMTNGDENLVETSEFQSRWLWWWQVPDWLKDYGPSPLQKFSNLSFSIVWPFHVEFHWGKFLFRNGCRWDSLDGYYNVTIGFALTILGILGWIFGGYIGFAWN